MSIPIDVTNMLFILKEYGFTEDNCDPVIIHQLLSIVQETTRQVLDQADLVRETIGEGQLVTEHALNYVLPPPAILSTSNPLKPQPLTNGLPDPSVYNKKKSHSLISYKTLHNPGLTRTTASLTGLMLKTFPTLAMNLSNSQFGAYLTQNGANFQNPGFADGIKYNPYRIGQPYLPHNTTNPNTSSRTSATIRALQPQNEMTAWGGHFQFPQALIMMGMSAAQFAIRRAALRPKHTLRKSRRADPASRKVDTVTTGTGPSGRKLVIARPSSGQSSPSLGQNNPITPTNTSISTSTTPVHSQPQSLDQQEKQLQIEKDEIARFEPQWPQNQLVQPHDDATMSDHKIAATVTQTLTTMPSSIPVTATSVAVQAKPHPTTAAPPAPSTSTTRGQSNNQNNSSSQLQAINPLVEIVAPVSALGQPTVNPVVTQRNLFAIMAQTRNALPIPPPSITSPALSIPLPSMEYLSDVAEDYSIDYHADDRADFRPEYRPEYRTG